MYKYICIIFLNICKHYQEHKELLSILFDLIFHLLGLEYGDETATLHLQEFEIISSFAFWTLHVPLAHDTISFPLYINENSEVAYNKN